jgi:hypothetical protein
MGSTSYQLAMRGRDRRQRRYDFDVTNTVNVSDIEQVRTAVALLFTELWPEAAFDEIWLAFHDFRRLFDGEIPGYVGCDTVYHDTQHSLDITLATARLIAGYEKTVAPADRLGPERGMLGVICALFHDAGYIRDVDDDQFNNGAEHTLWHVARSAKFLRNYLPGIGMSAQTYKATLLVHFTGYERDLDELQTQLADPLDCTLGCLLGTADLIAQMADRCYLEKCRDRLYLEFVLAGIAIESAGNGMQKVRYQSGTDLLLQTPEFYETVVKARLKQKFNRAYRYIEALYDGSNPYMEFIERNIAYLEHIIETGEWDAIRRDPPCFTANEDPLASANALVNARMNQMRENATYLSQA